PATYESSPLSLHDALPISRPLADAGHVAHRGALRPLLLRQRAEEGLRVRLDAHTPGAARRGDPDAPAHLGRVERAPLDARCRPAVLFGAGETVWDAGQRLIVAWHGRGPDRGRPAGAPPARWPAHGDRLHALRRHGDPGADRDGRRGR